MHVAIRAIIGTVASVVVGTEQAGLWFLSTTGGGRTNHLEGRSVRAVAPASWKTLWAAVGGGEIWRCRDLSRPDWARMASLAGLGLEARCLADTRANDEEGILVGTSSARLVRVGADRAAPIQAFDEAEGRDGWYTPWGGPADVRSITEDRKCVFVNVHVGGVLWSSDGGETWQPTIEIDADVHRVVTGAGRVFAAGAHGLSVSADEGETWTRFARGLHANYCRSVAVCGSHLLLSASDGPRGGRAALYRSSLDGGPFERCRSGLPEWFGGNIDSLCLDALPDGALAAFGTEAGDVFTSTDGGASWARLSEGLPAVNCVLVLP